MNFIAAIRQPGAGGKALYHVNDAASLEDARRAVVAATNPKATVLLCLRGPWLKPVTHPNTPLEAA